MIFAVKLFPGFFSQFFFIQSLFTYIVPFAIAELGHKCVEPAATLKCEPLNSCITVLIVGIMKIFKCYASERP